MAQPEYAAKTPSIRADTDDNDTKGCAQRWQDRVNDVTHSFFESLTAFITRRPWTVIVTCLIITAVLSTGQVFRKDENNPEKLFTPTSSEAVDDQEWVESVFPAGRRSYSLYFRPKAGQPRNLLESTTLKGNLKEVIAARQELLSIVAPCVKELRSQCDVDPVPFQFACVNDTSRVTNQPACLMVSVGDYFDYDAALVDSLSTADILARLSNPNATDVFGRAIERSTVLGGVTVDDNGVVTGAAAFQLTGELENNREDLPGEFPNDDPESISVEKGIDNTFFQYNADTEFLRVLPLSQYPVELAEEQTFDDDFALFIFGYVLLIMYSQIVMWNKSWVRSRTAFTLASVVSVGMAIGSCFGLVAALGVKFNPVVNASLVILLGLGVDDTFVIVDNYNQSGHLPDPRKRLIVAVGRAGASILATSITDVVAFISGTSTVLPAIRAFCIYTAVGVLFDFMFQVTFTVACLHLDNNRIAAGLPDWCCCCRRMKRGKDAPYLGLTCLKPDEPVDAAKDEYPPTLLERAIGEHLPNLILNPIGRAVVLVVAAALLVTGATGAAQMETEFDPKWFVASNHRLKESLDTRDAFFPETLTAFLYTGQVDYFALQNTLVDATTAFANCNGHVPAGAVTGWYADFQAYLTDNAIAQPTNAAEFYTQLAAFLDTPAGLGDRGNLVFVDPQDPTAGLAGARIPAPVFWPDKANDQVDLMDDLRACVQPFDSLEPRAYTFVFLFIEGLAVIAFETLRNVLTACAAVLVVCLVLLADVYASVLVLLLIGAIDVNLLGFLYYTGYEYNSVLAINVVLSIGLAVDESLHIMHSFLTATGSRNDRARHALKHIGRSVFNGGVTTFLAVVVLADAGSYIFQVFFASFGFTILFGLFHGLVVLPVLLSLIGPAAYSERSGKAVAAGGKPPSPRTVPAPAADVEMAPADNANTAVPM